MPLRPSPCVVLALFVGLAPGGEARAQHEGHAGMAGVTATDSALGVPPRWHLMAQAIPVITHAAHTAGGADLTEGYVSQAAVMARGASWNGHARLDGTLNAEGLTMARGELSTGSFGEGYVDRRHPHTYLHELVVTGAGVAGLIAYSLSAGRGFAPFGTDDPMMRPFEKYPINHHLSQILERGVVMAAVRAGPAMLEAASFGGDEPTSPGSLPRVNRLGDSWSVRATALPARGVEVQGSYARVASPEQRDGFGLDQRKRSVSVRTVSVGGTRYMMGEWARTVDRDHGSGLDAYSYESALIEGSALVAKVSISVRLEQTDRPEEERLADPFRTPRPASDLAISGLTRWRTAALALTLPSAIQGRVRGYPFLELERLSARSRDSRSLFIPDRFYGSGALWMASAGMRVRVGPLHARMGRYGVALEEGPPLRSLGSTEMELAHQH